MVGNAHSGYRRAGKMTARQRNAAIEAVKRGESKTAIARKYGVTYTYINRLYNDARIKSN